MALHLGSFFLGGGLLFCLFVFFLAFLNNSSPHDVVPHDVIAMITHSYCILLLAFSKFNIDRLTFQHFVCLGFICHRLG